MPTLRPRLCTSPASHPTPAYRALPRHEALPIASNVKGPPRPRLYISPASQPTWPRLCISPECQCYDRGLTYRQQVTCHCRGSAYLPECHHTAIISTHHDQGFACCYQITPTAGALQPNYKSFILITTKSHAHVEIFIIVLDPFSSFPISHPPRCTNIHIHYSPFRSLPSYPEPSCHLETKPTYLCHPLAVTKNNQQLLSAKNLQTATRTPAPKHLLGNPRGRAFLAATLVCQLTRVVTTSYLQSIF
jgi:hypothetical protein